MSQIEHKRYGAPFAFKYRCFLRKKENEMDKWKEKGRERERNRCEEKQEINVG